MFYTRGAITLDEKGFIQFMKKHRKSDNTIARCVANSRKFENYLKDNGKTLDKAKSEDLELFAEKVIEKKRVPMFMWTLCYYFEFIEDKDMLETAHSIRAKLVKKSRKPFKLKDFRGVKAEDIEKLAEHGIRDTEKMLEAGKTRKQRKDFASKTGLHIDVILEMVKLSDLARLPGVKGIRARLYHDAGIDSIDKMAKMTAEELLKITKDFVEDTGFDGIAPLPKEAKSSIETAKKLPRIVEW